MVATDGGEMCSGDQPWDLGSVKKKIIELGSERLQKKGNEWGYVINSGASHIRMWERKLQGEINFHSMAKAIG